MAHGGLPHLKASRGAIVNISFFVDIDSKANQNCRMWRLKRRSMSLFGGDARVFR